MTTKAQVEFLTKLQKKKHRDQYHQFLVENPKVVWEEYSSKLLKSVYVTEVFFKENEDRMVFDNIYIISNKDLKKISQQVSPVGMLALYDMPKTRNFTFRPPHILLLDNIQDPGNLGTIIRTADWFGFNHVFLSKNCVDAHNSKVVAATMGSLFNIQIHQDQDLVELIDELKTQKYIVAVTDLAGEKVSLKAKDKIALVIGNEARGVSAKIKDLADKHYKILKPGKAESLNAAVAAGVIMHQIKL